MLRLLKSPQVLRSSFSKTPIQSVYRRAHHTSGSGAPKPSPTSSNSSPSSDHMDFLFVGLTGGLVINWLMNRHFDEVIRCDKEKLAEKDWRRDVLCKLKALNEKKNIGGVSGILGEGHQQRFHLK
ncbi:hypothetical protein L486_04367 [Kwoniella mangroviensis CBS 10435]|uniref:Uncharacterized protein n=1 Tax=Kwoniella mangroviensis CBS 10435 TaxID=1331196 RepID=A0A1B9IS28_9TREE|nr:hypothetical protein L486_04367 [Kwoniella mangroviensis CBS 10435]